jgi:hypothetical protein
MAADRAKGDFQRQISDLLVQNRQLPDVLCHYTNRSGLLGICAEKALHVVDYRALNDRTEVRLFGKAVSEEFAARLPDLFDSETCANILDGDVLLELWNVLVCSFTTATDNNFHWQAYGRQFGASLEFHAPTLLASAQAQGFAFGPVFYSIERAKAIAKLRYDAYLPALKALTTPLTTKDISTISRTIFEITLNVGAFFKGAEFESENEWRIVKVVPVSEDRYLLFKPNDDHYIVPYQRFDLSKNRYDFSDRKAGSMLTKIVLGPTPETKYRLVFSCAP